MTQYFNFRELAASGLSGSDLLKVAAETNPAGLRLGRKARSRLNMRA